MRRYYSGAALEVVLGALDEYRRDDWFIARNLDVPTRLEIRSAPVLIDEATPLAQAETCLIDSMIVMAPLEGTDSHFALDDDIVRTIASTRFVLEAGTWKIDSGEQLERTEGAATCD